MKHNEPIFTLGARQKQQIEKSIRELLDPECIIDDLLKNIEDFLHEQAELDKRIIYPELEITILESLITQLNPGQERVNCADSQLLEVFEILSLAPVSPKSESNSRLYQLFYQLSPELPSPHEAFDKLQLLIILSKIRDSHNCKYFFSELTKWAKYKHKSLFYPYHILFARFEIWDRDDHLHSILIWLRMIALISREQDIGSLYYIIIQWLVSGRAYLDTERRKNTLLGIYKLFEEQGNLVSLSTGLQLFNLADSLMKPDAKMAYFSSLTRLPEAKFSSFQLQKLYFFAGNYSSGIKSNFGDAIHYFKSSNYYLYKCWETHRTITNFLRDSLSEYQFHHSIRYWNERIHEYNNQISIQNNAYLENLQIEYDKIQELYKEVEELSLTDALTGLRNRRYLELNVHQMVLLAARHSVPLSFIMIDIDHFKRVNDSYGHEFGDFVLKELSGILSRDFRKSDILIRYGGEEFLYVLFDSSQGKTARIMEDLRNQVQNHIFSFSGNSIQISISIGIRTCLAKPYNKPAIHRLIFDADTALYKAKNLGRNRICIFETKDDNHNLEIELDR